ncbi:hypothetical protein [Flavobacterium silvaticum]|uniref:Outer membrane protein beta-barrel domain-containing protein n=1 Tax=Flavobacterium silvaticum TaxID=1852020 RepID=A0A972JHJ5_9FLAO|nr:hypothetical protein [Flavobacterium silvaticum]NMH29306.1 hypothetical protein [Flavobacterium silvaticum]
MKLQSVKKLLMSLALVLGVSTLVSAQDTAGSDANYDKGFRLGFGVSPGYVFDDPYGFALGGDVRLQYDFSKRYSVTLTTGYDHFFADDYNNIPTRDLGMIPVKAGFKAFFWEDQFYVMGEAGAAIPVTKGYDDVSAVLSPSIGWANKSFDLSLRYEYYSDVPTIRNNDYRNGTGQIALRFAYGFRL